MKPEIDVVLVNVNSCLLAGSATGSITDDPFSGNAGSREFDDLENLLSGDDPLKMLLP